MFESPETYKVLEYSFAAMAGILGTLELPKYKIRIKVFMWTSLILVFIFGVYSEHLTTKENTQTATESKKTLETSQKILDSVSKQLVLCKASITTTTTNNYYNMPPKNRVNDTNHSMIFSGEPLAYGVYYGTISDITEDLQQYFGRMQFKALKVQICPIAGTNGSNYISELQDFIHGEGYEYLYCTSMAAPIKGVSIDTSGVKKTKTITIEVGWIKTTGNVNP